MGKKRQKSEQADEPEGERRRRVLVVYNSVYGNTRAVAEAIGDGLRGASLGSTKVDVVAAHRDLEIERRNVDLLVVGGPTHHHGMSDRLELFISRLCRRSLAGLRVATFDTRYRLPLLLTGSAARDAEKHLRRAGAGVALPPETFFVERGRKGHGKQRHKDERLEAGELDRAREWGAQLVGIAAPSGLRPHAA